MNTITIIILQTCMFAFYVSAFCQTSWSVLNSGTGIELYGASFLNKDSGLVAGQGGNIYFTSNGGLNWQLIYSSPITNDRIECIHYETKTRAWAGSYGSLIYKTTDGGNNWDYITISPPCRINDIEFINENTGWLVGGIHAIWGYVYKKTTDVGISWFNPSASYVFEDNDLSSINFLDENTGFVCGANPYKAIISRSTDGGYTWINSNYPQYWYWGDLSFIDQNTGWAYGNHYGTKFAKTTDSGITWNIIYDDTTNRPINDVYFINENVGYYAGPGLMKTINGGVNWIYQNLPQPPSSVEEITFVNSDIAYVVGSQGKIYKTTNGGLTNFSNLEISIPREFSLYQNYPNPFNPVTRIIYELRNTNYVSLKVYDALGKEVAVLVNEKLSAGSYEVEFDGSNFPSGVYFYKLVVGGSNSLSAGNFSETKRMALIR